MKTSHIIYFAFLVLTFAIVSFDLSRREEIASNQKGFQLPAVAAISKKIEAEPKPEAETVVGDAAQYEKFIQEFKKETLELSKLQDNPAESQARLEALAKKMTQKDVAALYEIISNDKSDGDQRAIAVELLTIKNDTASLVALQNFVANNNTVNGTQWDRKKEFETVLRAQAVEGIATYPNKDIALSTLNYLQQKVDQKFLADRINRASAGLKNPNIPELQQQDDEALKKLIE